LGHIISEDGLRPDPKLTEAIRNYPTPENKNHVKSFLGLSGYYRKFIWDYANKARPLTILTRQKEEFRWGPEEESMFQFLKTCLLEHPILRFPDFNLVNLNGKPHIWKDESGLQCNHRLIFLPPPYSKIRRIGG
jgi:hypothetical protein